MFESTLWIALGGAIGSIGRFWLVRAFAVWLGDGFPWGTVVVNITGCFVIGFFAVVTGADGRYAVSPLMRQFVMIGICGGYTTFSAFSLQTLELAQKGQWLTAGLHVVASVILCFLAVGLGAAAANFLNQFKGT